MSNKYKRICYEDDIVVVKFKGKTIYKGMEDYEPMRREDWVWRDDITGYKLNTPDGIYEKYCLDID